MLSAVTLLLLGLTLGQCRYHHQQANADPSPPLNDDQPDESADGDFLSLNAPFTDDGQELFEGDLLLTDDQRHGRQALLSKLWTSPVRFALSAESEEKRDKILAGVQHWRDHSCLEFTEVDDGAEVPHIRFIKSSGCWSYLGQRTQSGGQSVSIGNGCGGLSTVTHEIAHALGIYHQQSRTDRDEYIRVNFDNIQSGKAGNFNLKAKSVNLSVPYDLTSVMHYGAKSFSANGQKTIEVLDVKYEHLISSSVGLSHRDKRLANAMYSCAADCVDPPTCQNGGFVGKDCTCVCAGNTAGDDCATLNEPYYGELACGDADMRAPGYVTTPNFPASYPTQTFCYWIVTAPAGQLVKVTFHTAQLEDRNSGGKCKIDYVGVRHTGDIFNNAETACGTELTGQSYTSSDNQFVVKFKSGKRGRRSGFNATVEFVQP